MRRLALIIAALAAFAAMAQVNYEETQAKANRFFSNREWASAMALYNYQLRERPGDIDNYGRAIVAAEMLGDSVRSMQLLGQAMKYSVPLDSVLSSVKRYSFKAGSGSMYENFMLVAARHNAWMERPLDSYLMRYYAFRRNGPQMVAYASKMLQATPANVECLTVLAEGRMIEGEPALAVEAWNKILEREPDNYVTLLNLANYYDIVGESRQALEYFIRAQALHATPYVADAIGRLEQALAPKR